MALVILISCGCPAYAAPAEFITARDRTSGQAQFETIRQQLFANGTGRFRNTSFFRDGVITNATIGCGLGALGAEVPLAAAGRAHAACTRHACASPCSSCGAAVL